jgi:hypothetical protein
LSEERGNTAMARRGASASFLKNISEIIDFLYAGAHFHALNHPLLVLQVRQDTGNDAPCHPMISKLLYRQEEF